VQEATATKRCPCCGETKPVDRFAIDHSRTDGRMNRCKVCDSARSKAYYHGGGRETRQKRCSKCGELKFASSFHARAAANDGLQGWCKDCALVAVRACWAKNRERYNQKYSKRKPFAECEHCTAPIRSGYRWCEECRPQASRLATYGLTIANFEEMAANQRGRCAICNKRPDALVVDHCHETGVVRGLLCGPCNRAIGVLGDNAQGLGRAFAYLSRHAPQQAFF
jgi:hypothetical protein